MVDQEDLTACDDGLFNSPDLLGQECNRCWRVLFFKFFDRDASYRTGYKPTCIDCLSKPRLSMVEHTARLAEQNHNSEAVKKQRHQDQDEFRKESSRWGRTMAPSEFLMRLKRAVPTLFVTEGGVEGDVALYVTAPSPQKKWDGRDFKYLGYIEFDTLPEHSIFEFDEQRDVLVRASRMGWRSVLLRFIKASVLTEDDCEKEFGPPSSGNSSVWFKELKKHKHSRAESA